MKELKNKFIEVIKDIDFEKLTISELQAVASISETVDKLAKKDYTDMLGLYASRADKPKTIAEMGKEK